MLPGYFLGPYLPTDSLPTVGFYGSSIYGVFAKCLCSQLCGVSNPQSLMPRRQRASAARRPRRRAARVHSWPRLNPETESTLLTTYWSEFT